MIWNLIQVNLRNGSKKFIAIRGRNPRTAIYQGFAKVSRTHDALNATFIQQTNAPTKLEAQKAFGLK